MAITNKNKEIARTKKIVRAATIKLQVKYQTEYRQLLNEYALIIK